MKSGVPIGIASLVGRFLFKAPPGGDWEAETDSDPNPSGGAGANPVSGFWKRRRNGDFGEAAEGDEGEEDAADGLRWERVREIVSCGEESIQVLLQKRDDDGENTGELQTATEQDIVRDSEFED